jgi:hypothetical protein
MDYENLKNTITQSRTYSEVLKRLGIRAAGGNFNTLKKYIKKYEIDITHFEAYKVRNEKLSEFRKNFVKKDIQDYLVQGSDYNRGHLKERLYSEKIKERNCEICGQGEEWNGKKMSLILDHINGIWNDNRIENLRIVCPNCNATLETHCGKQKKKKTPEKKITEVDFTKRRKVDRPEYAVLIKETSEFGFVSVGKKYGVSDNAIRKWVKFYEKHGIHS